MRWHNGRSRRSRNLCPSKAFKGRIHVRRPFRQPHSSLAKRRRTIHDEWATIRPESHPELMSHAQTLNAMCEGMPRCSWTDEAADLSHKNKKHAAPNRSEEHTSELQSPC